MLSPTAWSLLALFPSTLISSFSVNAAPDHSSLDHDDLKARNMVQMKVYVSLDPDLPDYKDDISPAQPLNLDEKHATFWAVPTLVQSLDYTRDETTADLLLKPPGAPIHCPGQRLPSTLPWQGARPNIYLRLTLQRVSGAPLHQYIDSSTFNTNVTLMPTVDPGNGPLFSGSIAQIIQRQIGGGATRGMLGFKRDDTGDVSIMTYMIGFKTEPCVEDDSTPLPDTSGLTNLGPKVPGQADLQFCVFPTCGVMPNLPLQPG